MNRYASKLTEDTYTEGGKEKMKNEAICTVVIEEKNNK